MNRIGYRTSPVWINVPLSADIDVVQWATTEAHKWLTGPGHKRAIAHLVSDFTTFTEERRGPNAIAGGVFYGDYNRPFRGPDAWYQVDDFVSYPGDGMTVDEIVKALMPPSERLVGEPEITTVDLPDASAVEVHYFLLSEPKRRGDRAVVEAATVVAVFSERNHAIIIDVSWNEPVLARAFRNEAVNIAKSLSFHETMD